MKSKTKQVARMRDWLRKPLLTICLKVVCTALFASLIGCADENTDSSLVESKPVAVETIIISPEKWSSEVVAYGKLAPFEEYEISVDITATVNSVLFDEGQNVKAGQKLLELDSSRLQLQVEAARADVASAAAKLSQAKATHERSVSVFEKGAISAQQLRQTETDLQSSRALLARTRSALSMAERNIEQTVVKSPISGTVRSRSVEPGQTVRVGQTLGTISGSDSLRVEAFVSHKDVALLNNGAEAKIYSSSVDGAVYDGTLSSVHNVSEPETGNYKIFVNFHNHSGLLREGMAVKVVLSSVSLQDQLIIPREVVIDSSRELAVFKLVDGRAQRVAPTLGMSSKTHYLVLDGLSEGDELITSQLRLISDKQVVVRN